MDKLTKQQINFFATLEHQYNNKQPLDFKLIKELSPFGKGVVEILTNMWEIIEKNDDYRATYLQNEEVLPSLVIIARDGINNSCLAVDEATLQIGADRQNFRKARETFVEDHLTQTSDTKALRNLRDYVYAKAAAIVHEKKDFKENPELEKLMGGCQICERYLDLSQKHIKGILYQFGQ